MPTPELLAPGSALTPRLPLRTRGWRRSGGRPHGLDETVPSVGALNPVAPAPGAVWVWVGDYTLISRFIHQKQHVDGISVWSERLGEEAAGGDPEQVSQVAEAL